MSEAQLVHVPRPEDDPGRREPDAPSGQTVLATRRVRVAQRRARVVDLLLQQVPQREIARREHVGLGTISDDVKAIKAMWAGHCAEAYGARVAVEDAKLDLMERAWLPKALDDEKAAGVYLRIVERRAKLHGFDQPTKIDGTFTFDLEEERERGLRLVEAVEAVGELG